MQCTYSCGDMVFTWGGVVVTGDGANNHQQTTRYVNKPCVFITYSTRLYISAPGARMTASLNLPIHAHALGSGEGLLFQE